MPQLSWHRLVTSFDAVSDFTIPLHLLFMTSFLTTLSTAWETVYWWYMCTSRPAVKSKGEGPRECVEISESGDDPQTVCSSRGQLGLCGRAVACLFLCTRQPAQIRSEDDFQSHNGIFSQRRERGGWIASWRTQCIMTRCDLCDDEDADNFCSECSYHFCALVPTNPATYFCHTWFPQSVDT